MPSLTIRGRGQRGGEIPVAHEQALQYFEDIPAFILKMEEVERIKPLATAGTYLVRHHPIGGLNYYTTVVYVLVVEAAEGGFKLGARDFDADKIESPHQVLKGFVDGFLAVRPAGDGRTAIHLDFTLTIDFPLPGALRLLPHALIQSTADGIMGMKVAKNVDVMYGKVLDDFRLQPAD